MVPELRRIPRFVLDVQQGLQPLGSQALSGRAFSVLGLVQPVRCHAGFGNHMHLVGAHLELDVHARGANQRGVQRLVAVEFGNRDVVFELAGHWLVHLVQNTEGRVAIGHGGHNDPKAVDVRHLGKAQVLEVHLLIDGVQRFLAPSQAHLHADLGERSIHFSLHFLNQIAPAVAGFVDRFGQRGVAPGVQVPEGQILQFAIGLVQAQAVGNRGIDFQRLGRDAAPFAARHVRQRAHVVRAVGQLDEDDAHIPRHGQQHFAERLGLVLFAGVELELVQLGEAVHQLGHGGAKPVDQVGLGHTAVFHGVVQQRRHQRVGIELPRRALCGDRNGVGDVRLATVTQLPQVGFVGKAVRLAHLFDAGGVQVVQAVGQCGEAGRSRIGGRSGCRKIACRGRFTGPGLRCRR